MLEIDTIEALEKEGTLSASTLYSAEVARLPRLSREEQKTLVDLARSGQEEARHRLLLNCLHWTLLMAHRIYKERRPLHIEVLDLAGEANLKMVEKMEKALAANDPIAYLMTIAIQTIRVYCTYHAPLIQRPEWYSRQALAELDPFLPPMESLDEPLCTGSNVLRSEQIAAPVLDLAATEQQKQRTDARFALLYQAITCLNRPQRATTVRLYGLFGQPRETMSDIASASRLPYYLVKGRAQLARHHLRHLLTNVPR